MKKKKSNSKFGLLCVVSSLFINSVTAAQTDSEQQPDLLEGIGIEQRLNDKIPLHLTFTNEHGEIVELSNYFENKPVILSLVYYECPMLCSMILNGLLKCLNTLNVDVGKEFDVLTISFDPGETDELALAKKKNYLHKYGRASAENGWHFLTGDESSIRQLTEAVGFRFQYDPKTDQYAHASGIMVLTPDGTLSRYFYGIEYAPRDVRFALIEASKGKIGSVVDQLLLYCYHYDPTTGKYGVVIMNVMRIIGLITVFTLAGFMIIMLRRDKKIGSSKKELQLNISNCLKNNG